MMTVTCDLGIETDTNDDELKTKTVLFMNAPLM